MPPHNAKSPVCHASSWRNTLPVHPAAELFPPMSPDELRELGADIVKKNGLVAPIALWRRNPNEPLQLLDGRNRLDAIELVTGRTVEVGAPSLMAGDFLATDKVIVLDKSVDPYSYVISANIQRRHLTAEQRRSLIAKLLKVDPSKSDRQIAATVKASPTTVGTVRAEMEAAGEVSNLDTRIDAKGVQQPAKRSRRPQLYREAKLGADTVAKIQGTSLDSAAEMDELVILNRGAPKGELTKPVTQLVAAAAAGQKVSAVEYTKSGAAFRREDVGVHSAGEAERLRADNDQLRADSRLLEIRIAGLESEVEELKAENTALRANETAASRNKGGGVLLLRESEILRRALSLIRIAGAPDTAPSDAAISEREALGALQALATVLTGIDTDHVTIIRKHTKEKRCAKKTHSAV